MQSTKPGSPKLCLKPECVKGWQNHREWWGHGVSQEPTISLLALATFLVGGYTVKI